MSLRTVVSIVIGAALLAAALLVAAFGAIQVSAQQPAVSIGSANVAIDDRDSVDLMALDIPAPGLGAWTIDVTFDPTVVRAIDCVAPIGVCNTQFAPDTVRLAGADANGLEGDTLLATLEFECEAEGTSPLALTPQVFADATVGDPQPLEPTVQNGSFVCQEGGPTPDTPTPTDTAVVVNGDTPTPTSPAAATATPVGPAGKGLPPAGSGPAGLDPNSPQSWLIAGLAGAGIAWLSAGLAGAGLAFRRRMVEVGGVATAAPPVDQREPTPRRRGRLSDALDKLGHVGAPPVPYFNVFRLPRRRH